MKTFAHNEPGSGERRLGNECVWGKNTDYVCDAESVGSMKAPFLESCSNSLEFILEMIPIIFILLTDCLMRIEIRCHALHYAHKNNYSFHKM